MQKLIVILALLLSSCSHRIVHTTNKHNAVFTSKMQTFAASYFSSEIEITFTERSIYELESGSTSWNKITGRGGLFYNFSEGVRKSEQMIVWRCMSDTTFEVTYYWRKNYEMGWDTAFYRVGINEPLVVPLKSHLRSPIATGAYFGGREPAPHRIEYFVRRRGFRLIF